MTVGGDGQADEVTMCSARGCRLPASHVIHWRNPRLHSPDRRKTWSACEGHLEHLSGFLSARGFPVESTAAPGSS